MAALTMAPSAATSSPFRLDDERAYRDWRERKLAALPARIADVVVEIGDPRALTASERAALAARCRATNMVVYASAVRGADKDIPRLLAAQFGLSRLDRNWLADDDGVSRVT